MTQPFMLVIAGPNGSGKTTLTRQLIADGVQFGQYINPDDLAEHIKGSSEHRSREAQRAAESLRQECLSAGRSFSFETVMSHRSKLDLLAQAKTVGFRVGLFFVATIDPELNVARVRQRVALGGHPVPEDRIRRRYDRVMDLLPDAVMLPDVAVLFDNSYRPSAGAPIIMRPFLRFDCDPVAVLEINPPTPLWSAKAETAIIQRYLAIRGQSSL